MNSFLIFLSINLYAALLCSAYSTPILLLPEAASEKSLSSQYIGFILCMFPIGAFPATILAGKYMQFYKKRNILLIFNLISSVSRLGLGLAYFIENPTIFLIVSMICNGLTGISEGLIIPILYSFIPKLYPNDIMVKIGYLEMSGSIGLIIGAPFASFLKEYVGYVLTFTTFSSLNLFIGILIIVFFIKDNFDNLNGIEKKDKNNFNYSNIFLKNKEVLISFVYLSIFYLPYLIISAGYENYVKTLHASNMVSALLYSLILVGFACGIFFIKLCSDKNYERKFLFFSGLLILISVYFYGPDPIFEIEDDNIKLIFMAISFFITGICSEFIFLIISKNLFDELVEIFPNNKTFCEDMASGLYNGCIILDSFIGPFYGGIMTDYVGFPRIGSYYGFFALLYFILFWNISHRNKTYNKMVEETSDLNNVGKDAEEMLLLSKAAKNSRMNK